MFTPEMTAYLSKLLSSWQVIAVTVALLIYFKLIFYVASARRSRSFDFSSTTRSKPKKEKKAKASEKKEALDTDDLGLSE
jgi:hypothetical protein